MTEYILTDRGYKWIWLQSILPLHLLGGTEQRQQESALERTVTLTTRKARRGSSLTIFEASFTGK
jgi:hypothetical protein